MIGLPRSTHYRRPREAPADVDVEGPDAIMRAAIPALRKDIPAYGYR